MDEGQVQITAGCRGNRGNTEAWGQERREERGERGRVCASVGGRVFSQQLSAVTVPLIQI